MRNRAGRWKRKLGPAQSSFVGLEQESSSIGCRRRQKGTNARARSLLQNAEKRRVLFSSLLTAENCEIVPEIVSWIVPWFKLFAITIDNDFFIHINADQRQYCATAHVAGLDASLNGVLE